MDLKITILAAILSAVFTFAGAYYHYSNELAKQQTVVESAQVKEAAFCGGYQLGKIRISEITCNGKQELCICGDPSTLKRGLK